MNSLNPLETKPTKLVEPKDLPFKKGELNELCACTGKDQAKKAADAREAYVVGYDGDLFALWLASPQDTHGYVWSPYQAAPIYTFKYPGSVGDWNAAQQAVRADKAKRGL